MAENDDAEAEGATADLKEMLNKLLIRVGWLDEVIIGDNEKAVLLSDEKPKEFLVPGRYLVKRFSERVEKFPREPQRLVMKSITVLRCRNAGIPIKSMFIQEGAGGTIIEEVEIDMAFFYEFPDGGDLMEKVGYYPPGDGSVGKRTSDLIREEVASKISNLAAARNWKGDFWRSQEFQRAVIDALKRDQKTTVSQLRLRNCKMEYIAT